MHASGVQVITELILGETELCDAKVLINCSGAKMSLLFRWNATALLGDGRESWSLAIDSGGLIGGKRVVSLQTKRAGKQENCKARAKRKKGVEPFNSDGKTHNSWLQL